MKPWQHRVLIEKAHLAEKMDNLQKFTEGSPDFMLLPLREQEELEQQLDAMGQYYQILCTRANRFEFN